MNEWWMNDPAAWNSLAPYNIALIYTRVMELFSSEDRMIVAWVICVWQTDGWTDSSTIASTALCIASYADALYKTDEDIAVS